MIRAMRFDAIEFERVSIAVLVVYFKIEYASTSEYEYDVLREYEYVVQFE